MTKIMQSLRELLTTRENGSSPEASPLATKPSFSLLTPGYKMVRPFKKGLPNVKRLSIENNSADPLFRYFGMTKKFNPKLDFVNLSWRIKSCNRYMEFMQNRLERLLLKGEYQKFWLLACIMIKRSKVLRAFALRKLEKNWGTVLSIPQINYMMGKLELKCRSAATWVQIIRQYEPKGDNAWRPVGNPRRVDRMYTYIWQCFVVMFFGRFISQNQHAYLPGKGVHTAMKAIKELMLDEHYTHIREFDLKGAFPSVRILETLGKCCEYGLPKPIAKFLIELTSDVVEEVHEEPRVEETKSERLIWIEERESILNNSPAMTKELARRIAEKDPTAFPCWRWDANPQRPTPDTEGEDIMEYDIPNAEHSLEDWMDFCTCPLRVACLRDEIGFREHLENIAPSAGPRIQT